MNRVTGEELFVKYKGKRMTYKDLPDCAKRTVDEASDLINVDLVQDCPEWLYGFVEIPLADLKEIIEKYESDRVGMDIGKDVAVALNTYDNIDYIIDFGFNHFKYYDSINAKMVPCVIYI